MYDPNMQYYEFDADGKTEEVAVPVEKTNAWLEEMKGKGWNVRPMEYFKFRGEKGETASVPRSELDDFYQSAMESGKRFAPVFTMVDARTGEEREFARWGRDARGSDEQAQTFIDADRESLANAQANGWMMKSVQDPKAKDIYDHFWNAENWTDPTGEDGALVWNAKNIAKGVAATAVAGATGVGKAIPNAVLNIGAAGASLVGADDVADKLRQGRDWVNRILDHSVLTERILSGPGWDNKALKDWGLKSAESLGSLWGLGGAVKTVAKGLKLASGVEAAMEHASAGQAATINKMAGGAALATIMGAEAYEGAMADPRIRDAGPKGKAVAAANLLTAAATSRLFGKIVGLGVNEQLALGIAKESFADALKVTGMEMLEFAGINELNAATDESAKLLTGLSDRDIGRITKRFVREAVEGGKTVFMMRGGRYGRIGAGKAMERMSETAERIAHHAAERRGVYFHEATNGFGKIEGRMEEIRRTNGGMTTEELVQEGMKIWEKGGDAEKPVVVAVTESGVGVLDDGGMVRNDDEGKKEVVTPNGVVVDETGGVKTVALGRCGNVGKEYGVRVEVGRTADKPGAEIPSFGRQTVENACILLNEIEQGTCRGEVVDIDAITDILPSWKGEGGNGAEAPAAENLPNAPLIVLEGTDGSLRLVNGRGRLAYAKAQGARQVRAVKLREADGWTPELAYCVDVVENLRGGAPIGGDAAVAAMEKLGLGYAEAKEMGLVGAKGGIVARAAVVVEYGSQHLIDAVKSQIIPFETAERIVDSTVGDRLGVKSEEWNALTKELTRRLSLATRDEARDVMFELDRLIQAPGADMADPASRKAVVDAAVDAALERRRAERAERNGTTVEEEAAIGSTPVETEDGRLTTVRGLEREKEEASHAEAQSRGEDAPEEETKRDATVGTELKPKEDGAFGCAAFPGARMSMQTVERADGTRGEAVVIEGLTAEEMLKPERREEATAFLQRAAKAAQEAGKELCIPDEAAREAAMRLLEDRAVDEAREEMARAEEQRRTDEVAASGQAELANKVFGGTATVRVGTERERAEVERMASDGDRRQSVEAEEHARWNAELDRYERGEIGPGDRVTMWNRTPVVLRALGAEDLPIMVHGGILDKITGKTKTKSGELHGLTVEDLRNAQIELDNPIAVFRSRRDGDSLVVLTRMIDRTNGKMSVVALKLDVEAEGLTVNAIASAYGKPEFAVNGWIKDGQLLYVNKQARKQDARWLQLPGGEVLRARGVLTEKDFSNEQLGVIVPQSDAGGKRKSIGEKRYLRDGEGVFGYWDRAKKECVLFRGADETTLAHEMGWHAAYQWAEKNNPALFRKMREWAASCPEELREAIREAYGQDGPLTEDVLLDEFGAGRFEREHAETLKRALRKPEAKHWWTKLMRMVADAWKGALRRMGGDRINLKNIERMTPEEAVRFLAGQMAKGRKLGEFGEKEQGEGGKEGAEEQRLARRAGTVKQRVPSKERAVFRGEFTKLMADYAHSHNGEQPMACGLFTSEAYYLFDIIDGQPINVQRKKINARNKAAIETFDRKYKSEIYLGTRSASEWYDWLENEYPRLLQGDHGAKDGKEGRGSAQMDVPLRGRTQGISDAGGNKAEGERSHRLSIQKVDRENDLLPAREAMAHIWEGGVRVVKEGAPGYGEQSEAGRAAGAEAMNADVAMRSRQNWSVSMSELLELLRAMTGNPAYPRVMKAMKERPWLGQVTKKGEIQIDAELFGIVDRTDRDVIKNDLKRMGMFRNEDPAWSMRHLRIENENEREASEFQLTTRLKTLADQRIAGTAGGGNRTALNVMAHEIGHIACDLPVRPNDPAILRGLHTLGDGLIKEFQKADVKKINLNQRFPGLNAEAAGIKMEALEFVRWWRGVGDVNAGPGKGFEDYFRRNDRELWAEVFGAFLAAPHELEARAPAVFREIKDAIGRSDVLMNAFRTIRVNRGAPGGAAETVMRLLEREWTADRDEARRKLESEIDVPVGGVIEEWKEYALKALVSQESPARHVVARAGKEQIAAAKKALADAKRKMRKGKATKADVATAEKTLADVKEGVKRSLEDMDAAILDRQRGGGRGREYAIEMLQQFSENVKDAGLTIADFSRYLHAMNVKEELKGRATAAGMSAQEAHQVIEEMKKRLGKEKFTRLEAIDKMFHATYEKMILDDANLKEAFGEGFTNYCRSKAHYVTTRKQLGVDEIKTLMDERIRFKAMNPGRSDVMAEVGALIAVFGRHGSYADGDGFMKRLEGSFKMQGEPIAATLEKSMYMLEFGSRNHFVCELARIAKERNAEGFHVVEDEGRLRLPDNRRYGCVSFLKDGKRCTLIMPKAVAEGLRRHIGESNVIIKAQRMLNEFVTSYSMSFLQRNMIKSRASAENNLHFMRPSRLVTTAGYMGFRPEAVLLETAASFAVTRLPEKVMDNPVMRLVYGDATILGQIKQADRYARWMFHPEELSAYRRRADELAAQGDTQAAYAILSDIQHWKKLTSLPVFADMWNLSEKNKGRAEQNVIEIFRRLGIELDDPNIGGWAGRMVGYAKRSARWVKMYNNFEEARVKIAALLAAEAYNQGRLGKGREPLSEKQIAYDVATYAGSPRFENRGTFFSWLETWAGSFLNVSWQGVKRTGEALVRHPWEWGVKAVNRISARAARQIGLGCGGFAALAHWLVQYFDEQGEEEMKKTAETIERFAKRATLAYGNVSDQRRRHNDIIPLGTCGKWTTFGISVPLSDEDNLLAPFVDMTVNAVMKNRSRKEELEYAEWYGRHSEWQARRRKAKRRGEPFDEAEPKKPEPSGLTDPADMSRTWSDAAQDAIFGSGMVADVTQGTMLLNLFEDTIAAYFRNPYNTYTGRKNYEDEVFENRNKSWEGFKKWLEKTGKQAWNDVGGRVLFPMTTWDEDEGDIGGATRALWQKTDMGTKGENGTVRTEPDWFGKGVFHLLHDFPVLSSAACGMIFMNNGGNRRMMRRLQEIKKDNPMQAQIDRAAMEIIDWAQANGKMKGWKDDEFFEETTEKHGLSDEDKGTVMDLVTKKLQRIAEINGDLDIELRKAVEKLGDEGWYSRRVKRLITGYGLQEIIDGN